MPSFGAVIGQDLGEACRLLIAGKLVAIPTETVYGLGGHGFDEKALTRIFEAKNRPTFDPLILHVGSMEQVATFVSQWPPLLLRLAKQFWPGPLTVLLPRTVLVPDLVTAGLPAVAVRMPDHPLTLALLRRLPFPVAAPSANPFGYISPTEAAHVAQQLGHAVSYILDGGPCRVGVESTIVGLDEWGNPAVVRLGGISWEELEPLCPGLRMASATDRPRAPGELPSHYAPRTPFTLMKPGQEFPKDPDGGYIYFAAPEASLPRPRVFALSPGGEIEVAARELYRVLRAADLCGAKRLYGQMAPEKGLGRAINDRLRRAAGLGAKG